MRKIPQAEIQPLLFDILKAFKAFAEENSIPFMLCGGTTLGAVRHHGFIPWDDDIDVYVRAEDWNRLEAAARKNPLIDKEGRFRILLPGESPNVYPFIKVIDTRTIVYERNFDHKYATGLWIDVFRLSYWPDSLFKSKRLLRRQMWYRMWNKVVLSGNIQDEKFKKQYEAAKIAKPILAHLGMDSAFWCRKMIRLDRRTSGTYVGNVRWSGGIKDRYRASWFDEKKDLSFEGINFQVPGDYDAVLTAFYGNYMQPPPEDQRVRHDFDAYYLED